MASIEGRKSSLCQHKNVNGEYVSSVWASKTNLFILKDQKCMLLFSWFPVPF